MSLQADYFKKTFQFNFRARTSRGLMRDKTSWFVRLWDSSNPRVVGVGECGPLAGLSIDSNPGFEDTVKQTISRWIDRQSTDMTLLDEIVPSRHPSLMFGFETALLDLKNGGTRTIYQNDFVKGRTKIPINGLIWMGDMDFMMNQINEKIALGFRCIKLKVGGLDFDRECDMLNYIRKRYFRENIMIRLDANGGFKIDDVLFRLTELAKYNVDSIEQPIKPGLPEMEELCRKSPIPVAFDEELVGKESQNEKEKILDQLKPKLIILKPTLHGGIRSVQNWISLAEARNIGWWITSALESNVGLNAICQLTANYPISVPQGLGTGAIYANNFNSPLIADAGFISYQPDQGWDDIQS
jgi:o-succinylbenzoate synthase